MTLYGCTSIIESLMNKKIVLVDRTNITSGLICCRDDLVDTAILKVIYPCSGYDLSPNIALSTTLRKTVLPSRKSMESESDQLDYPEYINFDLGIGLVVCQSAIDG